MQNLFFPPLEKQNAVFDRKLLVYVTCPGLRMIKAGSRLGCWEGKDLAMQTRWRDVFVRAADCFIKGDERFQEERKGWSSARSNISFNGFKGGEMSCCVICLW